MYHPLFLINTRKTKGFLAKIQYFDFNTGNICDR